MFLSRVFFYIQLTQITKYKGVDKTTEIYENSLNILNEYTCLGLNVLQKAFAQHLMSKRLKMYVSRFKVLAMRIGAIIAVFFRDTKKWRLVH